jgi:hypothetical protein
MEDPELLEALEKLHQELDEAEDLDDESRQKLQHLAVHIRTVLDREEADDAEEDESFFEQIGESIQEYQASHPGLTAALQHALDILSGAGI